MRTRIRPRAVAALALVLPLAAPLSGAAEEEAASVQAGSKVQMEYTLKLDDGSVRDTNVGETPLEFEQGKQQILPALEEALAGAKVDETREVTLPPEQGYGVFDPSKLQKVELNQIPEDARKPGTTLVARDGAGNQIPVRVREVRDDFVVIDLNHPLAGEVLHFTVRIVAIE